MESVGYEWNLNCYSEQNRTRSSDLNENLNGAIVMIKHIRPKLVYTENLPKPVLIEIIIIEVDIEISVFLF